MCPLDGREHITKHIKSAYPGLCNVKVRKKLLGERIITEIENRRKVDL